MAPTTRAATNERPWLGIAIILLGSLFLTEAVCAWMATPATGTAFLSPTTWMRLASAMSGSPVSLTMSDPVSYPFWSLFAVVCGVSIVLASVGALIISRVRGCLWRTALGEFSRWGWSWGIVAGAWEWVWIFGSLAGGPTVSALMIVTVPFWASVCLAGWMTTFLTLCQPSSMTASPRSQAASGACSLPRVPILVGVAIYGLVFVTMNWRLWFNLYIPHGDSAMYEEHLWNLWQGKGFRSYLDQGLFLGEHVQLVHLGLLPLYVLWPSHLLLELCESLALAGGAFPVAAMTLRQTRSRGLACCAAAAYLLYPPMQFLDIEIDLKTFRPEAFGIPLFLLTLDQLDRRRLRGFLLGVLACFTVKEDYSLVMAPLGCWIASHAWFSRRRPRRDHANSEASASETAHETRWLWTGVGLAVGSVIYLFVATRLVMPWFREGAEIHYASYFTALGDNPEAIVTTIVTRPGYVVGLILTTSTLLYALAILMPVGGIAVLSPGRLAVGLPLFGVLCLNELARDPRHQFHAPLVPIIFWATAAGLPRVVDFWQHRKRWFLSFGNRGDQAQWVAGHWLWTSGLAANLLFSLGPLGLSFWDPGSNWYWGRLYGPNPRGEQFARIMPLLPRELRVASTDFAHPRFTHHARSYDYSAYARRVSGYERRVPDDTDAIVIDTTHPYSEWKTLDDIPEYHDSEHWEAVAPPGGSSFLVLKRRRSSR